MASALSLVVLGQAYFFITPNVSSIATNSIQIPSNNIPPQVRRDDYNYTPGIGAHKVHTEAKTWNEAWQICRNESGNLAVINSLAESRLIKKLIEEARSHAGIYGKWMHIGFHDLFVKNEWVTVHGESLVEAGFNEWYNGEPNNHRGIDERCGSMHVSGTLNDIPCNVKYGFICELPFVLEPVNQNNVIRAN